MGFKPGPPPDNEPTAFEFLTDNRLLHNAGITKLPTTQQDWNTFIQELNKWIKNETGSFDPTFTGFSENPAAGFDGEGPSIWWHRYGQLVHMEFIFGLGTSNSTSFTITGIPEIIRPRDDATYILTGMSDNSASLTNPQTVQVGADGTLTFYSSAFTGEWTASGNKGFGTGNPSKNIIYSLRQPGKH